MLLFGEHRRTRQSGKHDTVQSFYKTPAPKAPTGGIPNQTIIENAEFLSNISTLGALRLEHVENFCLARSFCPQVKLIVAEDTEAVVKIIKKGRSAKL